MTIDGELTDISWRKPLTLVIEFGDAPTSVRGFLRDWNGNPIHVPDVGFWTALW